ncbi:potassium transporter [Halobacteriales archaeon QS_1_68_20]|nr:MAG: potassium transporter [Halobacteriales archaeon QS_1_68_20]
MSSGPILPLVAAIIALGVGAKVLADRYQVPSVLFLLLAGILLGPVSGVIGDALGFDRLVSLETFGDALSPIVGLAVAIIVFEGAFHLKLRKLRESPAAALRLVTVGAVVSLVGTAIAVRFALGSSWRIAFLVGALLVATGPTVITPIMDVVPVRDRVAAALETEGIVNDVTAAILAVVVFESLTLGTPDAGQFVSQFLQRLGVGVVVGIVIAVAIWYLVRFVDLSPGNAPQNARLLVLAGAIVAFSGADTLASEAGIAAAATAGVLLGNADLPYEEDIEAFKGDITLVVLSFVFIALAALLEFDYLLELGFGGIVLVAAVALVVRPLLVFLSATGDRLTTGEKLFMSFVAPRGIIPASVSTLFAIEMTSRANEFREEAAAVGGAEAQELLAQAATYDQQSQILVGTVFLVIMATVAIEGGLARHTAEFLDVIPMRVIVVGGGKVGRSLTTRLEARGENVVIVEEDRDVVETARKGGFTVHSGDGTDSEELQAAGIDNARTVVATTGDDEINLLVAQLATSKFDVENVIARVNDPSNVDAFEDLNVRTISSTDATAWAIDNAIERPALARWMTQIGREGDVQEVEVNSSAFVGRPIREIGPELPAGCLVALVTRDGETFVPAADDTIQRGDHVTLLGQSEAVHEAMQRVNSE